MDTPTETQLPTVTPEPERTALIVPVAALRGADVLMLHVWSRHGGVIDMLKFVRRGDAFVLEYPASAGGE